ncbi:MAG: hypothetical protein FVQ83_08570 [Chloroflexi bacterium]|nr:hypothetical protein [Chloroflexota bacterium]
MKSIDLKKLINKPKLLTALFALVGFAFMMLSTQNYGAGLSPDSVEYIAVARNINSGAGLVFHDGTPLIVRPPLYPALLALTSNIFEMDPVTIANILNAFIFSLIVFFGGQLVFKYLSSFTALGLIGMLIILVSTPLFKVSTMAWSEPLFILFVLISILFADSYFEKKGIPSLIGFSLFVGLSCLVRYMGVSLIIWGALIILVLNVDTLKNKITHLSLFTLISGLPLGAWLIRNYAISGTLFGPRSASPDTLFGELVFLFNNLSDWYIPGVIADHRSLLILVSVTVGVFLGLNPKDSWQSVRVSLQRVKPSILFVITYTACLIIITTLNTSLEPISNRYLSPIYIPLTLLLVIVAHALAEPYRRRFSIITVNSFLIIGIAIWLAYPLHSTFLEVVNITQNGQRYSSKAWLESETIHYLLQNQSLESECTIYTNDPFASYILAHLIITTSPAKPQYPFPENENEISTLRGSWPEESRACLVWFDVTNRPDLLNIDELKTVANLAPIMYFDDGGIYSVVSK